KVPKQRGGLALCRDEDVGLQGVKSAPPNATDCGHKGFEKPRSRDIPKQLADNITRAFQNRSLLVKVREGVIASYGSPDEKGRRMITIDLDLNSQLPAVGIAFTQSRTTTVLWFIMDDYDFTWSNDPEAIKKLCEELPAICELVREDNSVIIALRKKNEPARSIPMGSNPGRFIDDGTGIVDAYNAALKEQELAIFRVMASGESFRVAELPAKNFSFDMKEYKIVVCSALLSECKKPKAMLMKLFDNKTVHCGTIEPATKSVNASQAWINVDIMVNEAMGFIIPVPPLSVKINIEFDFADIIREDRIIGEIKGDEPQHFDSELSRIKQNLMHDKHQEKAFDNVFDDVAAGLVIGQGSPGTG
ncbi:hypothetical protein MMC34_008523, partial [Xylographa carneopallida]|nr:hypothetical protein [Xylographa carneopallida]